MWGFLGQQPTTDNKKGKLIVSVYKILNEKPIFEFMENNEKKFQNFHDKLLKKLS